MVIDFDETILKNRITTFQNLEVSDNEVKEKLKLVDNSSWNAGDARKAINQDKNWEYSFTRCLYRPFDIRFIFYHKSVVERNRFEVMRHMKSGNNLGMIAMRQVAQNSSYSHFGATNCMVDNRTFYSNKGIPCLFPLYLYPAEGEMQFGGSRHHNLNPDFIKVFSEKLGLKFIEDSKGDLQETFGPEDIFDYAYAIFHSPTYRIRYALPITAI